MPILADMCIRIFLQVACLQGLLLMAGEAAAMSYTPVDDRALLQQADIVVTGQVLSAIPAPGRGLDATSYQVAADEWFKGDPAASLEVEVPGAFDPEREGALVVTGAPRFQPGESVLLFLVRGAGGALVPAQLALGAFHYRDAGNGVRVLEPDVADAVNLDGAADEGLHREAQAFLGWLRAGAPAAADYWRALDPEPAPQAKFLLVSTPSRWFEFDEGRSVTLYSAARPQPGLADGGYGAFQQALSAWNNDASSRVRLAYGGLIAAGGGLGRGDGVNQILFDDPHGDISGSFNCVSGGVTATTVWRTGATRQFQGRSYRALSEIDIVIQDGAGCVMSRAGSAAEVMAHELGHALGLDHPCGDAGLVACVAGSLLDQALMRPTMHADGRGAALGADDKAGIYALYPESGATAPTAQAEPSQSGSGSSDSQSGGATDSGLLALLLLAALAQAIRVRSGPVLAGRAGAACAAACGGRR